MIRLTEIPLNDPVLNDMGILAKVWLQYFGDLQGSLIGYWGRDNGLISSTGVTAETTVNKTEFQGRQLTVHLDYTNVEFSSATFSIEDKYSVLPGVLQVAVINGADVTIANWVLIEGTSFSIPDITADRIIVSGVLLRDTGE